jgi:hypothetical protein
MLYKMTKAITIVRPAGVRLTRTVKGAATITTERMVTTSTT